jgi:hypothetical protein
VQLEEDQMASTLGEIETQGEDVRFLRLLMTESESEIGKTDLRSNM